MTAIQKRKWGSVGAMQELIEERLAPRIESAGADPRRVSVSMAIAAQRSPDILKATPQSLGFAILDSVRAGMEPDGRVAAIVTRNKNAAGKGEPPRWVKEAQFVPMYQGMIEVACEDGAIEDVRARVVYANDRFKWVETADGVDFEHEPTMGERGAEVGGYVVFTLPGGGRHVSIYHTEDFERFHGAMMRQNKGKETGAWSQHRSEMLCKAMIRSSFKTLARKPRRFSDLVEMDTRAEIGAPSISADEVYAEAEIEDEDNEPPAIRQIEAGRVPDEVEA